MSVRLEIDAGTLPRLGVAIEEIRKRLESLDPVLKRQAATLSTIIDDSFRQGRSPTGEVWKPLADSTVARRRRGSSKPLVDTSQLRSATNARAESKSIVFGTSGAPASYGVFHVTGTKHTPRRAYLPLDSDGNPDFSSGPAAEWLNKTRNRMINYILRGENQR